MQTHHLALAAVLAASPIAAPAAAQPVTFDWVTVGNPGNAGWTSSNPYYAGPEPVGAVDYAFRIMRTQVSYTQWLDFCNAYSPFYEGNRSVRALRGDHIWYDFSSGSYWLDPKAANWGAKASFDNVARYCNWLHNGQVNEAWAFESGAYDMTGQVPVRQEGATYWVPSLDEWVKAAFYDPNRYGEGQGGYWRYMNMRDEPLVYGPPESGADAIGDWMTYQPGFDAFPGEWDLERYPWAQSAYGMLDAAGATEEWTDTAGYFGNELFLMGSLAHSPTAPSDEFLWPARTSFPQWIHGFRLATTIPAPAVTSMALMAIPNITRRRRAR